MKKKLLILSLVIMLFNLILPTMEIQAATPYMKKLNVKFDLEENTCTTIRTNWAGDVWVKSRAMIRNIKVKNDNKKDYKQLTCDIFFERSKLSKNQVKKILHSNYYKKYHDIGSGNGGYSVWIYDYDTGTKGIVDNVNVKFKYTIGKLYKNKDFDGCWIKTGDYKIKLTITYPKNYKKLCIGISGNGSYKYVSQQEMEILDLKKHPIYKKDRKYIHFMRIK